MYTIAKYIIIFLIYSIIGTFAETVFRFFTEHHWYGVHGFLNIPIFPIYGIGALLIIFIGRYVRNPVLLFFVGGLAATIMEFCASWLIEAIFGVKIWDYSNDPLNFQGRIRFATGLGFAIAGVLLVFVVHPFVLKVLKKIPKWIVITGASVATAIIVIDIIYSAAQRLM